MIWDIFSKRYWKLGPKQFYSDSNFELAVQSTTQIQPTDLIVPHYYLNKHEDVRLAGADAVTHFLRHGLSEERDANPFFDPEFYKLHMMPLAPQPNISNAYIHYIQIGSFLDLWTSRSFDPVYYRNRHKHLSREPIHDALVHFLTVGVNRGWFATTADYADLEPTE